MHEKSSNFGGDLVPLLRAPKNPHAFYVGFFFELEEKEGEEREREPWLGLRLRLFLEQQLKKCKE